MITHVSKMRSIIHPNTAAIVTQVIIRVLTLMASTAGCGLCSATKNKNCIVHIQGDNYMKYNIDIPIISCKVIIEELSP